MRTNGSPPTLPSLPRRLPRKKNQSKADALFELLLGIAGSNRHAQPQTFYSLREVAQRFTIPLSLVGRVFLRLEAEGLLGSIRGSRTILHGTEYDRRLHVRGVVGLPVSIFRFSAFADYRAFITQMRRQLRRRGFMPAAVFFERHEGRSAFLAKHLLEASADTVVWFSPDRKCRETLAALRDAGVRVIRVGNSLPTSIPCRYGICRENGLRTILREWHAAGLTSTVVVSESRSRSARAEERYRAASEEELLPAEALIIEQGQLEGALASLAQRGNRGILLTESVAAFCALRVPETFSRLLTNRRVALVDGPISMLFATVPAVPVDLVVVDWPAVVGRIVSDLITQGDGEKSELVLFHAEAHLRVPLDRFCHEV